MKELMIYEMILTQRISQIIIRPVHGWYRQNGWRGCRRWGLDWVHQWLPNRQVLEETKLTMTPPKKRIVGHSCRWRPQWMQRCCSDAAKRTSQFRPRNKANTMHVVGDQIKHDSENGNLPWQRIDAMFAIDTKITIVEYTEKGSHQCTSKEIINYLGHYWDATRSTNEVCVVTEVARKDGTNDEDWTMW